MSEANSRVRLTVVGFVVFAMFSALFAHCGSSRWGLAELRGQTERNRIRTIREPPSAGSIVDDKGKVLVQNTLVDTITVKRGISAEDAPVTVTEPRGALCGHARVDRGRARQPEVLGLRAGADRRRRRHFEQFTYISSTRSCFPVGSRPERQSIREYPDRLDNGDPVASHLLGYVASINKQEYKIHKGEDYTPNDLIGKQGVEQLFESELKGKPRRTTLEVDSRGRLVGEASVRRGRTPGNDVELTIDANVQKVAENSLDEGMNAARGFRDADTGTFLKAAGGAVIVMNAAERRHRGAGQRADLRHRQVHHRHPGRATTSASRSGEQLPAHQPRGTGLYAPGPRSSRSPLTRA